MERPCSLSMFTLTSLSSFLRSSAIFSSTGETAWHGPHHSAQKSTSTGVSLFRTSASNVASVTSSAIDSFRSYEQEYPLGERRRRRGSSLDCLQCPAFSHLW